MAALKRNVAGQNFTFVLVNSSTGAPLSGASVSVFVTKDAGAQASGAGTVTSQGNGQYNYAPTTAETNAVDVGFTMIASGAVPVNVDFHTDLCDANGFLQVDLEAIHGFTLAAQQLAQSTQSIVSGTVGSGSTTTSVNVSSLVNPSSLSAAGQLIGRAIIFLGTSLSGAMQSQASLITGSTTGGTPTLTVDALTNAPASGDIFVVL